MKITYLILTVSLCAAIGYGQGSVVAESSRPVDNKVVKTAPYSAEAISNTIQTLSDGNKVNRTTTSRIYRDSEGRYRREDTAKEVGVGGAVVEVPETIVISDPVAGYRWALNTKTNTAMATKMRSPSEPTRSAAGGGGGAGGGVMVARPAGTEPPTAAVGAGGSGGGGGMVSRSVAPSTGGAGMVASPAGAGGGQRQSKTESLGTRMIEGLEAEGTRVTVTIPAGAMGNEQPIESVYDRWYSKELDVVVLSSSSNPASGTTRYRLTNIKRENPPLSLFAPPADYKIIDQAPETRTAVPTMTTAPTVTKRPENPNL